ncbi:hypothetical protein AX14_005476 [Amanita brunnescens Koide BX004]|nr:hypothetical protein AX14_005476 [Amanita brunnescens Koide BX004]
MSSTTMSAASIPQARCAIVVPDKDAPAFHHPPDPPRAPPPEPPRPSAPSTPSPKSPAVPLDKHDLTTSPDEHKTDKNDDVIDKETFDQILDLDEDGAFLSEMIEAFFEQATKTFKEMDEALDAEDLKTLHSLGHFLKGSSAAIGVSKVKESCEQIQHYGVCRDEELHKDLSEKEALAKTRDRLKQVKTEYAAARQWLDDWLSQNGDES